MEKPMEKLCFFIKNLHRFSIGFSIAKNIAKTIGFAIVFP